MGLVSFDLSFEGLYFLLLSALAALNFSMAYYDNKTGDKPSRVALQIAAGVFVSLAAVRLASL